MNEPQKLKIFYDENSDVVIIEGIRFSGEFFRAFSAESPLDVRIWEESSADGMKTVRIQRLNEGGNYGH